MSLWDDLFVEPDESVNGPFSDLQGGKVREKVIANKETHENPVIYGSLEGGREGETHRGQERGEGEEVGDGERGEKRRERNDSITKAAGNSPPGQREKADHQYEVLSPNTAAQNLSNHTHI